ncbi:hypothetical protein ACA910_012623 [Epithemia clementina (nom. ined.)]
MFNNGLTGSLPPEIVRLSNSLTILDLGQTYIFALPDINTALGQLTNLVDLRYDQVNFVSFTGVPTEIGNLKNLEAYGAANTLYTGALNGAAFPSDMTALSYIEIEFNSFNSTIPAALGSLPALKFLFLRDCLLTGNINFMQNMQVIEVVWVDTNFLSGSLPSFLANLNTLVSFSVTENAFSGPLPSDIGSTGTTTQMFYNDNQLTGQIPADWGSYNGLEALTVQNNLLTGTIPAQLCALRLGPLTTFEADCPMCIAAGSIGNRPCCTNTC